MTTPNDDGHVHVCPTCDYEANCDFGDDCALIDDLNGIECFGCARAAWRRDERMSNAPSGCDG